MRSEEQTNLQPVNDAVRPQEDWFLQSLVGMVNTGSIETGITLTVGGFQVTGMLISGRQYFEEFGSLFAGGVFKEEGPDKEELAKSFATHGEIYGKADEGETPPPPTYIHLRGAKFFGPGGQAITTKDGGVLWRGRIAEVSGFLLGSYGT